MKKHLAFSLALTLLLFVSGMFTIPMVSEYSNITQNWMYALARIPLILGASLAFYGWRNT